MKDVKRKLSSNKISHYKTGGGPFDKKDLTELEDAIFKNFTSFDKIDGTESYGVEEISADEKENNIKTPISNKGSSRKPVVTRNSMLQQQVTDNSIFQEKLAVILEERNCIEREKLEMMKQDREEGKKYKLKKLELKALELEILKTKNEIELSKINKV